MFFELIFLLIAVYVVGTLLLRTKAKHTPTTFSRANQAEGLTSSVRMAPVRHVERLYAYVHYWGGRDIRIDPVRLDHDQSQYEYQVYFSTINGGRFTRTCEIRGWGGPIVWLTPIRPASEATNTWYNKALPDTWQDDEGWRWLHAQQASDATSDEGSAYSGVSEE